MATQKESNNEASSPKTMATTTTTSALKRIWKQIPLHRLTQGATLTLRSSVPIAAVTIKPSWRDNGAVHLQHHIGPTSSSSSSSSGRRLFLTVDQTNDTQTSLGRLAPSVNLVLSLNDDDNDDDDVYEKSGEPITTDQVRLTEPSKPIDKVIYDDGTIEKLDETTTIPEGSVRTDYHDGIAHIHNPGTTTTVTTTDRKPSAPLSSPQGDNGSCWLTIETPEAVNLICDLVSGGDIVITNKIEGDVKLSTARGNIRVHKLRGHHLDLAVGADGGSIYAAKLLEAQNLSVTVQNGRIRAKQIHGTKVKIIAAQSSTKESSPPEASLELFDSPDDEGSMVDISSLFVTSGHGGGATIRSSGSPARRSVRVKSHHGPLHVEASGPRFSSTINPLTQRTYPVVELGGVNGSCEVFVRGFPMEESDNDAINNSTTSHACEVHIDSLAPDTVSLVSANSGDIGVTLDRKVEADLRLASLANADALEECTALLADEESEDMVTTVLKELRTEDNAPRAETNNGRIEILTSAFLTNQQSSFSNTHVMYSSGIVVNKSEEPDSRFDRKVQQIPSSLGKIRLDSAADQALDSFSSPSHDGEHKADASSARALFAVACAGRIKVETVSWFGAIARRYGFTEDQRELGRTASRKGRPLKDPAGQVVGE